MRVKFYYEPEDRLDGESLVFIPQSKLYTNEKEQNLFCIFLVGVNDHDDLSTWLANEGFGPPIFNEDNSVQGVNNTEFIFDIDDIKLAELILRSTPGLD